MSPQGSVIFLPPLFSSLAMLQKNQASVLIRLWGFCRLLQQSYGGDWQRSVRNQNARLLEESKDGGVYIHETWLKNEGLIQLNRAGDLCEQAGKWVVCELRSDDDIQALALGLGMEHRTEAKFVGKEGS